MQTSHDSNNVILNTILESKSAINYSHIDSGKVMKVVFSGSVTFDPIVIEEITVSV